MARPSKELVKQRQALIEEYKRIFDTLKYCGGGLYVDDLATLLDMSINTLKYRLDKCVNVQLVLIDKVTQGTTHKNIVRLTKIGWTNIGVRNRNKCSSQEDTLNFFFYRAIYQKRYSCVDENNNMIVYDDKDNFKSDIYRIINDEYSKEVLNGLDAKRDCYNQKSILENLDILNKNNFIITDSFISKGMIRLSINCIYRKIDVENISIFMDLIAGICEMCAYLLDDDYFHSKNFIKIDFTIITESKLNKTEVCKAIKKHNRNFHIFSKEKTPRPNLYNSFKYYYKNRIGFAYVDKKQGKVIEY